MAEAAGASVGDPDQAATRMEEARAKWLELGRPLDAARCLVVQGRLLLATDPDAAGRLLDTAATEYEEVGAPALAAGARDAVQA
jgi:hypothetical protein